MVKCKKKGPRKRALVLKVSDVVGELRMIDEWVSDFLVFEDFVMSVNFLLVNWIHFIPKTKDNFFCWVNFKIVACCKVEESTSYVTLVFLWWAENIITSAET